MQSDVPEHPSRPTVAVVIPVFDDRERLARCLDALEAQSYPTERFEILVVDNGSSEDIVGLCRAYPTVRYLHEAKPGSYAARNKGIEATNADILAFTDSDCIPHEDWLENGVSYFVARPECDIVGGSVTVFPKNEASRTAVELYESAFAFPQRRRIETRHWGVTANLLVRRSVLESVGPFDPELLSGGDAEWGQRAHAAGHRLEFAEDVQVDHPARENLRELLTKARRVAGGARAARHGTPKRYLLRYLMRTAFRGARRTLFILTRARFDRIDMHRFTVLERIQIAAVQVLVTFSKMAEAVRLRLTRRSANRT